MKKYTITTITHVVYDVELIGKDIYVTLEQGRCELAKNDTERTVMTDIVLTIIL